MISSERKNELKKLLKSLKVRFSNYELLNLALSHKSFINEKKAQDENNERLEFLGDSVLGLIITEFLYKNFSNSPEGDLARIKSYIVSEEQLSKVAMQVQLHKYIRVGKGEEYTGGRYKKAILADTFEAFLGALYLDSNYVKVQKFVISLFSEEIDLVVTNKLGLDYKTLLQEYIQKKHKSYPKYILIKEEGPEHDKVFHMEVILKNKQLGSGCGKSKKEAEKSAAKNAYQKLTSHCQATSANAE